MADDTKVRIAAIQTNPKFHNIRESLDEIVAAIEAANFQLAVLPELALSGYMFESPQEAAMFAFDPADAAPFRVLTELLKKKRAYLAIGFAERSGNKVYNSSALLGPEGVIDIYRKVHLFGNEPKVFLAGDKGFNVVELKELGARVGMMICFDWVFPEAARTLALLGADIILHPANLVLPYCQQAMPIRALENGVFTITANRIGSETLNGKSLTFTGASIIASPTAKVLARAPKEETATIYADIDLLDARTKPVAKFEWRRPETYKID